MCDAPGIQSLKPWVKTPAAAIFSLAKELNVSENFWQRRLLLVLAEWYTRDKTVHPQINKLVQRLENDKEYYVRKVVEWIYRNLEKGR